MALKITKSTDTKQEPSIRMLVYGQPGVGKTTLAVSGKNAIIADAEGGTNMLGSRGIEVDIAQIHTWEDIEELYAMLSKDKKYDTVVVDPLGELLDKLIAYLKKSGFSTASGGLSLPGWGAAKDKFRGMLRAFRDLGVDLVCVAHTTEKTDDDLVITRPKLMARLEEDVCAMMDVVGYMQTLQQEDGTIVHRTNFTPTQKFYAKDRSGKLPDYVDDATFPELRDTILKGALISVERNNEKNEEKFLEDMEK